MGYYQTMNEATRKMKSVCPTCHREFLFRDRVTVGIPKRIFRCPECGERWHEVGTDVFMGAIQHVFLRRNELVGPEVELTTRSY